MMKVALVIAAALASVEGFVASPRPMWVRSGVAGPSPTVAVALGAPVGPLVPAAAAARVTPPAQMGLFGLGTPEIAIIAAVGLLVLGPDQVGAKSLARAVLLPLATILREPSEGHGDAMRFPLEHLACRADSARHHATDCVLR